MSEHSAEKGGACDRYCATEWHRDGCAAGIAPQVEEPIEVGWYAYSGGRQTMVFHLRDTGQWSAHLDNGTAADCAWGYIEQALGVWDLVPMHPSDLPGSGVAQ